MTEEHGKDLDAEIRKASPDGRIECAVALDLARRLDIPPKTVGDRANSLGIKIVKCQLGCFS